MGGVYLLGDREKDDIYKIGVTRGNVQKRIKSLQTGNSGEIYLLKFYECEHPFLMEQMLHNHYSNNYVNGEWFYLSTEEVKNFEEQCIKTNNIISSLKDNCYFSKKINN